MGYLLVFRENPEVAAQLPLPAIVEMVEGTAAYIDGLLKEGKASAGGFFAESHGGYLIVDAASHAELFDIIDSVPARGFCNVESHPLLSTAEWRPIFDKTKARMLAAFEKMVALMGGTPA